jgi:hypothetical protein
VAHAGEQRRRGLRDAVVLPDGRQVCGRRLGIEGTSEGRRRAVGEPLENRWRAVGEPLESRQIGPLERWQRAVREPLRVA